MSARAIVLDVGRRQWWWYVVVVAGMALVELDILSMGSKWHFSYCDYDMEQVKEKEEGDWLVRSRALMWNEKGSNRVPPHTSVHFTSGSPSARFRFK